MKNKKLLTNLLFAVVILAIAAVLLVVRRVHASGSGLRDQGRCSPVRGFALPGSHLRRLWLAFQRRSDRHLPSGPCSADHCTCFLTKRSGFE